jgi:hypothetical protein
MAKETLVEKRRKLLDKLDLIPVYANPPYTEDGGLANACKDQYGAANANVAKLDHYMFWENHGNVIAHDKVFAPVEESHVQDGKILTFLLDDRGYQALVGAELAKKDSPAMSKFDDFQSNLRDAGFAGIKVIKAKPGRSKKPDMGNKSKGYNRYYRMSQAAQVKASKDKLKACVEREIDKKMHEGLFDHAALREIVDEVSTMMLWRFPNLEPLPADLPAAEEAAPVTGPLSPTTAVRDEPARTEQSIRLLQSKVESEKKRQDQQQAVARETRAPSPVCIYRALGSGGSGGSSGSTTSSGALDLGTELRELLTTLQEAIQRKVWQMPKVGTDGGPDGGTACDTDGGTSGSTYGHNSGYVGGESDGYDSDPIAEWDGESYTEEGDGPVYRALGLSSKPTEGNDPAKAHTGAWAFLMVMYRLKQEGVSPPYRLPMLKKFAMPFVGVVDSFPVTLYNSTHEFVVRAEDPEAGFEGGKKRYLYTLTEKGERAAETRLKHWKEELVQGLKKKQPTGSVAATWCGFVQGWFLEATPELWQPLADLYQRDEGSEATLTVSEDERRSVKEVCNILPGLFEFETREGPSTKERVLHIHITAEYFTLAQEAASEKKQAGMAAFFAPVGKGKATAKWGELKNQKRKRRGAGAGAGAGAGGGAGAGAGRDAGAGAGAGGGRDAGAGAGAGGGRDAGGGGSAGGGGAVRKEEAKGDGEPRPKKAKVSVSEVGDTDEAFAGGGAGVHAGGSSTSSSSSPTAHVGGGHVKGDSDGSGWSCAHCTFLNKNAGYLACGICGLPRRGE